MALCQDPAVNYLRTLNYNVLRHPRADLAPLDVLGRTDQAAERLGPLDKVWKTTKAKPIPQPVAAADVKAQSTGSLKGSFGVKVLGGLLSGFGVGGIGGKFSLSGSKGMRFHFEKPEVLGVDVFSIGEYLSAGDLDTSNRAVERYFDDDAADVFIVTEVLRTNKLTIEFNAENQTAADADVTALEGLLKPEVKVARDKTRTSAITVSSDEPLSFGFKAQVVHYTDGRWTIEGFVKAGDVYLGTRNTTVAGKSVYLASRGRVDLDNVQ
jgi:hypothetical protein